MSEPVHVDPDDPHMLLRWAVADAIRDRLEASRSEDPDVRRPWGDEPQYEGLVSIYELAEAVVDAVLANGAGSVLPDEEPAP